MNRGLIIPILQTFENNGIRQTCNTLYPQDILYGLSTISSWPSGVNQHLNIDEPAEYDVLDFITSYEKPSSAISSLAINMGTCQVYPNRGTLSIVDGSPTALSSGYYFQSYEIRDLNTNQLYCSGNLDTLSYNQYTHSDVYNYEYNERRTNINCTEIAGKELKLVLNRVTSPYNAFLYNINLYRVAAINLEFCGSSIYTCGSGGFLLYPTNVVNSDFYRENGSFSNLHLSVKDSIDSPDDSKYISYTYDVGNSGLSTINLYCENELFENTPFFSLLKIRVKDGPPNYELSASWDNGIDLIGNSSRLNVVGNSGYQNLVLQIPVSIENEEANLYLGNNINIQLHGTGIKSNSLTISSINQEIVYNKCIAQDVDYSTLFITNNDFCNRDISPTGDIYAYPSLYRNENNSDVNKYESVQEDFIDDLGYISSTDSKYIENVLDFGLVPSIQNYSEAINFISEGIQNNPFEAVFQIRQSANYDVDISNIKWYDKNNTLIASGSNQTIDGISNFLGYSYPMSIQTGIFDLSSTKIYSSYNRSQPLDYSYSNTGILLNYQSPTFPAYSFYNGNFVIRSDRTKGDILYSCNTGILNHFNDLYDYYFNIEYNSISTPSGDSSYKNKIDLYYLTPSGDTITLASGEHYTDYNSTTNPIVYHLTKDISKSSYINSGLTPLYLSYSIDKVITTGSNFVIFNADTSLIASGNSFLREPFKISSISINASYECTGVEESGFIPLSVSGSSNPSNFIDLFLLNNDIDKGLDLYLHNFETVDSGIDLYIDSKVFDDLNLFIKSEEPLSYMNGLDLFLLGRPSGQINNSVNLYIRSFPEVDDNLNLYLDVASTGNSDEGLNLYLNAGLGYSDSGHILYVYGFDRHEQSIPLYLDAIPTDSGALNLYLYSNTPGNRSGINTMFVHGYDILDSGLDMFLGGTGVGDVNDTLNLFTKWDGDIENQTFLYTNGRIFDGYKNATMFVFGYNEPINTDASLNLQILGGGTGSHSETMELYTISAPSIDRDIDLITFGNFSVSNLSLYLENLDSINSGNNSVNLSLFADSGVDIFTGQTELFIRSDSIYENINLYLEVNDTADSSGYMNLFIEALPTNKNTELIIWNEISGTESGIDLTLQSIEQYSQSGEFNLFIERDSESLTAYTPMFLLVNNGLNDDIPMYIDGTYISDNNLTLFMPSSVDTYLNNVKTYIHGY